MITVPLFLLSAILWQGASPAPSTQDTATYESPALRAMIGEAARANRRVPPGLGEYRARMESEISIGNQRPDRGELAVSVEQVASELRWDRTGAFEQRVLGYRSQQLGLQFATLGFFRNAWAVPSLYGNRLALLFGQDTSRNSAIRGRARTERATVYAVHPLADDRERVYRFRGGDTVQVLRTNDREIRIVRVEVEPKTNVADQTVIFTGELDLDADRRHVVRMRGYFARVGGPKPKRDILASARLQGIAFVELVNSEVEQEYWLPSYQRFEAQATAPFIGDSRAVFRIVSRFRRFDITAPGGATATALITATDTLRLQEHRLTFAPRDSVRGFTDWRADIGTTSSQVAATDFDDVAPALMRKSGPPVTSLRPERVHDIVHINRVEGWWTGLGVTHQFRDAVPGLTLRGIAGYAWSEHAVRGRGIAEYRIARMRYSVRAGRSLDITNDFRVSSDSGDATAAIGGFDDYDYLDRRFAMFSAARLLPDRFGSALRVDVGYIADRASTMHLFRSPLGGKPYRPNRGALNGRYARTALTLDWRPDISGEMMRTGLGGRAYYERGDGQLNYQRVELRLASRWNHGRYTFGFGADAGQVFGRVLPPQQLFELGSSEALPGYEYKQFAGDRAALLRGLAMYRLNVLNGPIRLTRRFWLPSPSPALSAGIQAGWSELTEPAARTAVEGLDATRDPTSLALRAPFAEATGGVRATMTAGIRFFGGSVGVLAARPLDHAAKWRLVLVVGPY